MLNNLIKLVIAAGQIGKINTAMLGEDGYISINVEEKGGVVSTITYFRNRQTEGQENENP